MNVTIVGTGYVGLVTPDGLPRRCAPRNDENEAVIAPPSFVIASEARQSMNPKPTGLPRPGDLAMTNQQPIICIDPRYFRPAEVETLLGDPTQAKQHAQLKANGYQVNVSVE